MYISKQALLDWLYSVESPSNIADIIREIQYGALDTDQGEVQRQAKRIVFIGDDYYMASGTVMSSLYEEGTGRRYDWGFVQRDLGEGVPIEIRPATREEIEAANKRLAEIKNSYGEVDTQKEVNEHETVQR